MAMQSWYGSRMSIRRWSLLVACVSIGLAATVHAAAGTIPADGVMLAALGQNGKSVVVTRIKTDGMQLIYNEPVEIASEIGWSDAHTLWIFRETSKGFALAKVVDGKLADTKVFTDTDWDTKSFKGIRKVPHLYITKKGEVWVSGANSDWYLRADAKAVERSKEEPKDLAPFATSALTSDARRPFGAIKSAPKGFALKLASVTVGRKKTHGVTCKGPDASLSWPSELRSSDPAESQAARKVSWLRSSPPLARVDVEFHGIGADVEEKIYILGCREVVRDVEDFGAPVWGVYRGESSAGKWALFVDAQQVGELVTDGLHVPVIAPH
jgi:hypothetical protein